MMIKFSDPEIIERAISLAGGPVAMAKRMNCARATIYNFRAAGRIGEDWIEAVMDATGMSAAEIRPDLSLLFASRPPESA